MVTSWGHQLLLLLLLTLLHASIRLCIPLFLGRIGAVERFGWSLYCERDKHLLRKCSKWNHWVSKVFTMFYKLILLSCVWLCQMLIESVQQCTMQTVKQIGKQTEPWKVKKLVKCELYITQKRQAIANHFRLSVGECHNDSSSFLLKVIYCCLALCLFICVFSFS